MAAAGSAKGCEAYFTVLSEWMWSKPRIMEIYLNVAEWGDGIYGAEQAAQDRFGVSAKDLTPKPGRSPRRRPAQPQPLEGRRPLRLGPPQQPHPVADGDGETRRPR